MSRALVLLVALLAVASLFGDADRPATGDGRRAQVVVELAAPPLAHVPEGAKRIATEQTAFARTLQRELPDASLRWRYRLVLNGFAVDVPTVDLERLRALPGVSNVLAAQSYGVQLDQSPRQIGATELWGAGLETAGDGIKVGIIDTGVDPRHEFFDPTGYTMPPGFPRGQSQFTSAKVIVARAFAPASAQTRVARLAFDVNDSDHGTHVAGIAAGNANTRAQAGRVVSGVAPRAYIGNYKALVRTDSGLSPNGNSPELVAAIEAAVADGMDVINLSLGEPEIEPQRDIVARALDAAAALGVVPVVAAGNDYNDTGAGSVSSPANAARAITVAAVETSGNPPASTHAEFSSVGPTTISLRMKPDVAAPGVDILSSVPGGWAAFSGTSMASPHVAGAAALLKERHPAWTVEQVKSALVQSGTEALSASDRRLSPSFQGGGVVALVAADQPLLFAEPTGISVGLVARGSNVRGQIRLSDAGGGAGAWQTTVVSRQATPGVTFTVPASVDVPGTLEFTATATASAAAGEVSGYVELRRGSATRRVPFWGRVTLRALARHKAQPLGRPGIHRGSTAGRPSLVSRYRYPESPSGLGVTTELRGPELVYRIRLAKPVANFGVVVVGSAAGTNVEPRVVAGLDENRLTGYAGLPVAHNPYLDTFREPVAAAGALSPRPGEYAIVFDSPSRAGAGRFTFRYWVNDVSPPTLKLRAMAVARGRPLLVNAHDSGSGVNPDLVSVAIDGQETSSSFSRGIIRIPIGDLSGGTHRLRLRVSDYQETKNTENVARILPNTRTLVATIRVVA